MIYQFKSGQTWRGVDAQTAGEELERIRKANDGKLMTTDVVAWAAAEDSPLHSCFTWDTEEAARAHNLHEARQLIKQVVIVKKRGEVPRPAFWNVAVSIRTPEKADDSEQRYYQSAEVVANDPREYEAALRVVLRELTGAQNGLENLRLLAPRGTKMVITRATDQLKSVKKDLEGISQKE